MRTLKIAVSKRLGGGNQKNNIGGKGVSLMPNLMLISHKRHLQRLITKNDSLDTFWEI